MSSREHDIVVLMEENKSLRSSVVLWKTKYERQMAINRELERQLREANLTHLREMQSLQEKLQVNQNELKNDSTKDEIERFDTMSPGLRIESPSLDIDRFSSETLLQQVVIISRAKGIKFQYPLEMPVPSNLASFCFAGEYILDPYVFVLSGGPMTPCTRDKQLCCLDGAIFGVCVRLTGETAVCILSRHPFFDFFVEFAREIGKSENKIETLSDIEDRNENAGFRQSSLSLSIDEDRVFEIPRADNLSAMFDWGFDILYESLPLDQLLFLIGCLVLELKVVVVSTNPRKVSSFVMALLPLIRPLQWVQPFIPLLPQNMSMVCDSPVPVLVGTCVVPENMQADGIALNPRQEAILLNLDTCDLTLSPSLSQTYHMLNLPGLSEIYHDIESNKKPYQTVFQKHIVDMLQACRYFGQACGTFAVSSRIKQSVLDEAEAKLQELVPYLGRGGSPWEYLARLQGTQMYIQWLEFQKTPIHRYEMCME